MGYSQSRVAMPYQILTIVMNLSVLLLSVIIVLIVRGIYSEALSDIVPGLAEGGVGVACLVGVLLFLFVTVYNVISIRKKVNSIL